MFFANTLSQIDVVPVSSILLPEETPLVLEIIWRERQIPLARGGNIRGFFPYRGGAVPFESLVERDILAGLAAIPQVNRITSQPFTIHYLCDGVVRKYTPDFMVEFHHVPDWLAERGFDRTSLIEGKPMQRVPEHELQLGRSYRAVRSVMSTPLLVVTDSDLTVVPWGGDRNDD
ncbi:MAG TPA: hypothetical protein VFA81_04865 [Burkholderiales bacterium]|nr:hypothetical protein [Burkholderiales bacterium]